MENLFGQEDIVGWIGKFITLVLSYNIFSVNYKVFNFLSV